MEYPVNYDSSAELRNFLESEDLSMKKRFGQNFLVNRGGREKIISCIPVKSGDSVWEIGPGLGAMTWHLLELGADVTVFEIDRGFIRALNSFYAAHDCFRLVEGDFIGNFRRLVQDGVSAPDYIIGNLPYVTGSLMIAEIIKSPVGPQRMVFTLQKEVGLRMAAYPGGKDYSGFSLVCQSKYDVFLRGDLNPGSFYPRPSVQSCIVEMRPKGCFNPGDPAAFYDLIDDLFRSRRKTIFNNLRGGKISRYLDIQEIHAMLSVSGIDPGRRAETLSVKEIELMSNYLLKQRINPN